jgi:hypothetical protein
MWLIFAGALCSGIVIGAVGTMLVSVWRKIP